MLATYLIVVIPVQEEIIAPKHESSENLRCEFPPVQRFVLGNFGGIKDRPFAGSWNLHKHQNCCLDLRMILQGSTS